MAEENWADLFREYHTAAVQQGKKVAELLAAIDRDEQKSLLSQALNEFGEELALHRMALAAIRVGIETGALPEKES